MSVLKIKPVYMYKITFTGILMAILISISAASCKKVTNDSLTVDYEKYVMPNGLQVVLHTDHSDPMISYVIMYHGG